MVLAPLGPGPTHSPQAGAVLQSLSGLREIAAAIPARASRTTVDGPGAGERDPEQRPGTRTLSGRSTRDQPLRSDRLSAGPAAREGRSRGHDALARSALTAARHGAGGVRRAPAPGVQGRPAARQA